MKQRIGIPDATIGRSVGDLDTPALVIDAEGLEQNIRTMAGLVAAEPKRLRPHCKTHKSSAIAQMQVAAGALGVCCAKLSEADAVATAGTVDDVMITTPVVGKVKFERLAELVRTVKATVVVDNASTFEALDLAALRAERAIHVVIEVDVGQGRCGILPGLSAMSLVEDLRRYPSLRFKGLHGYHGKAQMVHAYQDRRAAIRRALELLEDSAEKIRKAGHRIEILTGGGSGSLAIDLELGGLNEFQPGSYVFMDSTYRQIEWNADGSPPPFQCCLTIMGGVVSRPAPDRAVIDIGWKSASSDSGVPVPKDTALAFEFAGDEHGIVRRRDGAAHDLPLGGKVELIPSHCDTTVNLHSVYHVARSGRVEAIWPIDGRGCSQ